MDDLQGRVGTRGALARKGTKPESSVPAPVVLVVKAATLPPTTPADLKLADVVTALLPHTEDDCPDFDPAQGPLQLLRLTTTTLLVLQPCRRGASLVIDSVSGGSTLDLHEAAKGRGIGDCWSSHDWTWSDDRLVLVSAAVSPCRLFEAGGLMMDLWRAQVEAVK